MIRWSTVIAMCASVAWGGGEPQVTRQENDLLREVSAIAATNTAHAIRRLEPAVTDKSSAALDYTLGNLRMTAEDASGAERAYRAAVDKAPVFTAAHEGLARALTLQGRMEEAEATLRSWALRDDATLDLLLLYGYTLVQQNKLVTAETVFRRAVWISGESVDALRGLAFGLFHQRRYAESAALMRELVERAPGDAVHWAHLADALIAQQRADEAIVHLESARRLELASASMLLLLGDLYLNAGQPMAAERYHEALAKEEAETHHRLKAAEAFLILNDADSAASAIASIERAGLSPADRARVHRLEADILRLNEQWANAARSYEQLLEQTPTDGQAMLLLGDTYRGLKRDADALLWYERAARVRGAEADAWQRIAGLHLDARDYDKTAHALEQSLVVRPSPQLDQFLQQVRRLQALQDDAYP